MITKLLIGVGLFTLGYAVGKAVGRAEAQLSGHLGWDGDAESSGVSQQTGKDAEFEEPGPDLIAAESPSG